MRVCPPNKFVFHVIYNFMSVKTVINYYFFYYFIHNVYSISFWFPYGLIPLKIIRFDMRDTRDAVWATHGTPCWWHTGRRVGDTRDAVWVTHGTPCGRHTGCRRRGNGDFSIVDRRSTSPPFCPADSPAELICISCFLHFMSVKTVIIIYYSLSHQKNFPKIWLMAIQNVPNYHLKQIFFRIAWNRGESEK